MKTKSLVIILILVGTLLIIPLLGMQFSDGIDWSLFDFLIMGILLFITGIGIAYNLKKIALSKNRVISLGVILMVFFLIWVELAVGVFVTPFAGS
ncbi:MAG: hypothetical protein R3214_04925 [Christiangramia sp.]|nr:hypothetical protein [Christiangramia sp.]